MTKEEIKALRKRAGLTQSEAAALVFCTLGSWQNYEYGHTNIPRGREALLRSRIKKIIRRKESKNETDD